MNLNEQIINKLGNSRLKRPSKVITRKLSVMGPPLKRAPKRRASTQSSSLNWGKSHKSIIDQSTSNSHTSTELESKTVVAITEGRGEARCEVGIAALNIAPPNLTLCQISDTHSYLNTLTKINIFNPCEIVFPKTFIAKENRLIDLIKMHFPNVKLTEAPRNTFNKTSGVDRLQQLILPELSSVLFAIQHRYYALAAASAVLMYVQSFLNIFYCTGSIKMQYEESEGYSIIDITTADRLELVSCQRPAQATKYSTLFGVLNHCVTKVGSRSLRSAILQPLFSVSYLEKRLNCVTEMIRKPEVLVRIQTVLGKIVNVHQLLSIATVSSIVDNGLSYRQLNYLLLLNNLLDLISPLKDILKIMKEHFFVEFRNLLGSESFEEITDLLKTTIHTDVYPSKGPIGVSQRCFLIKPGLNGLLDEVRKIYSERIDEMNEYVKSLAVQYNLPLSLGNNETKGYHIVLRLNMQQRKYFKKSDLPTEFFEVYRLTGSCTMKTMDLVNLSTRIDDILVDIIKISNIMVSDILMRLKNYIGLFYKICEYVAKLDMLQSLAQASLGNCYVRPKFSDFTEVTHAHHPLLDFLCSNRPVPNLISACKNYNMHIITGPNGSGKSIYIRQVLLLQVMAQIGCYVPAKSAIFKPADKIYARIGFDDNMESGASTFTLEIREINYIMTTMTDNSLIIIDELCRSTCIEEGTALALAICEKLLTSSAFIYVTTHFTEFKKLYDMYYNIKIWQLQTLATGDKPENVVLDFKYTLVPGMTTLERYGIYLVRGIWEERVIKDVDKMVKKIKKAPQNGNFKKIDERLRIKYDLEAKISKLRSLGKFIKSRFFKLLNEYQNRLQHHNVFLNLDPALFECVQTTSTNSNIYFLNDLRENEVAVTSPNFNPELNRFEAVFTPESHHTETSNAGGHFLNDQNRQENFNDVNYNRFEPPGTSNDGNDNYFLNDQREEEGTTYFNVNPKLTTAQNRYETIFTPESNITETPNVGNYFLNDQRQEEITNFNVNPKLTVNVVHNSFGMPIFTSDSSKDGNDNYFQNYQREEEETTYFNVNPKLTTAQNHYETIFTPESNVTETPNAGHYFVKDQRQEEITNFNVNSELTVNVVHKPPIFTSDLSKGGNDNYFLNDQRFTTTNFNGNPEPTVVYNRFEQPIIFTPDSNLPESSNDGDDDNYRHFSGFLNETSLNMEKFVPEVLLTTYSGENQQQYDYFNLLNASYSTEGDDDQGPPDFFQTYNSSQYYNSNNNNFQCKFSFDQLQQDQQKNQEKEIIDAVKDFESISEEFFSTHIEEEDDCANLKPLRKIVYNVVPASANTIKEKSSYEEALKEFESCSESFFQISFEEEEAQLKKNAEATKPPQTTDASTSSTSPKAQIVQNFTTLTITDNSNSNNNNSSNDKSDSPKKVHLFPKVIVIAGPNGPSISYGTERSFSSVEEELINLETATVENNDVTEEVKKLLDVNTKIEVPTKKLPIETNVSVLMSSAEENRSEVYDTCLEFSPVKLLAQNGEDCEVLEQQEIVEDFESLGDVTEELFVESPQAKRIEDPLGEAKGDEDPVGEIEGEVDPVGEMEGIEDTVGEMEGIEDTMGEMEGPEDPVAEVKGVVESVGEMEYDDLGMTTVNESIGLCDKEECIQEEYTTTNNDAENLPCESISISKVPFQSILSVSSNSTNFSDNCITEKRQHSSSSFKESDLSQPQQKTHKSLGVKRKRNVSTNQSSTVINNNNNNSSTESSEKKAKKMKRFKPPMKLTKREIEKEFDEQTRKLIEECQSPSTSSSKNISRYLNRPTVKQVQGAEELAHARRNVSGDIMVIPPKPKKKAKKKSFLPLLRAPSADHIVDVKIFSDKNSKHFEEFLKSDVKNYKLFNFDCEYSSVASSPIVRRKTNVFEDSTSYIGSFFEEVEETTTCSKRPNNKSIVLEDDKPSLTPDGYYKKNKNTIDDLLNKYLQESITQTSQECQKAGTSKVRSVFES